MTDNAKQLKANWDSVLQRVAVAAEASGRSRDDVCVVGVTKYVAPEIASLLHEAGCKDLGESRPQVLLEKVDALAELDVTWHMIGHLQRNKVAKTLPLVSLIHSVDSLRLASAIDRLAGEQGSVQDVLLEVNVSGEEAKHGFTGASLLEALPNLLSLNHIRLRGLMCMAGLASGEKETRQQFSTLRELRESLRSSMDIPTMTELSMGMSGDFELAIAEGATIVRVGSVLFEGV